MAKYCTKSRRKNYHKCFNVDGIMGKIEQLVNDYNELIDKVSEALNEKDIKLPSFIPEEKAMHEDDVSFGKKRQNQAC